MSNIEEYMVTQALKAEKLATHRPWCMCREHVELRKAEAFALGSSREAQAKAVAEEKARREAEEAKAVEVWEAEKRARKEAKNRRREAKLHSRGAEGKKK